MIFTILVYEIHQDPTIFFLGSLFISFLISLLSLIFIYIIIVEEKSSLIWALWLFFFINLFVFMNFLNQHNYLLIWVIFYSCLVNFSFLGYCIFIEKKKVKIITFKEFLESQYKNEEFLQLKEFWKEDFSQRKREKSLHKLWEYPLLVILSFFTSLRTRFLLVQNIFIARAFLLAFLFNSYLPLFVFYGVVLLLTFFMGLSPIQDHLKKVYGPQSLKKLGWNTFTKYFVQSGITGLKALGLGTGLYILDETLSPFYNEYRLRKDVELYNFKITVFEEARLRNAGEIPGDKPLLDLNKYDNHRFRFGAKDICSILDKFGKNRD